MHTFKPVPGAKFPSTTVSRLGGGQLALGIPSEGHDWQMIVVYRGKHCPLCTRYLQELDQIVAPLAALGIEVVAVSADSEERASVQIKEAGIDFAVGYGLTVEQMQSLGLYISGPRHGMDVEGPFSEPGLFVVNEDRELRMVDIANAPFLRPQLGSVVNGLKFMRGRTEAIPANGTYA